jgi:hypothetical protein
MAGRFAAITRHVRLTAIALLVAPVLTAGVPSAIGSGVLTASASDCNVTPGIYSNYNYGYQRAYVRMTATWGPSCPWQHNTLAAYEQIGYNDYYDVYGESLPPTNHGSADIPTDYLGVVCTSGYQYWAVANFGSQTVWSYPVTCAYP